MRLIALPLLAALALSACGEPRTDKAFGERVRAYLLENPEVLVEVSTKLQEKQAAEAKQAATKALAANRRALERDGRDFVANPNGKVTVVEFFDYNCGYCKMIAPEVIAMIEQNPDVRFVFKDMTIFGEASEYAAAAARMAKEDEGRYLALHRDFMAAKPLDEAGVVRIAQQHGVDPQAARRRQQDEAQQDYLADVHQLAQQLGIQGTPAFVIGDTLIPGADANALRQAIDLAKKG